MSKGNQEDFLKALFSREAGTDTKVMNYAGYVGKYQFGESALTDLGYYVSDGSRENDWRGKWTGKNGVDSLEAFRNNEGLQDLAAREWIALLCKRSKKIGLDTHIGKVINGIRITHSGIIAGAHLKGFGSEKHPGVKQFLVSNGKMDAGDGLGTRVSSYVKLFGDYELDCCNRLSVAFAEKETGAPIAGMKVQVKKNGKLYDTVVTDNNGLIRAMHGFSSGDSVEILVEKMTGGFKSLKTSIVQEMNLVMAFVSPKTKVVINTELHKGEKNKDATAHNFKRDKDKKEASRSKKTDDKLDLMHDVWERIASYSKSLTTTPSTKSSTITEQKKITALKTEKIRSVSGHPVNKIVKKPILSDSRPDAPMKKTISGLLFPLIEKSKYSYREGARAFGSNRDHGKRRHGGIDLYAPVGAPVRAMADGVVLRVYGFYAGTWAVEVDHGDFIARYGEVGKDGILVSKADKVLRGQQIGEVGKLIGLNVSMLHLEMYGTTESPNKSDLTQRGNPPFQRRNDLIDPTDSIDIATLE